MHIFCPQITIKHNNKLHAYNKYVLTAKVSLISKISYSFLTFTYPMWKMQPFKVLIY